MKIDHAAESCIFCASTAIRLTISPTVVVFLAAPANRNAWCKGTDRVTEGRREVHAVDFSLSGQSAGAFLRNGSGPVVSDGFERTKSVHYLSVDDRVHNGFHPHPSCPGVVQEVVNEYCSHDVADKHPNGQNYSLPRVGVVRIHVSEQEAAKKERKCQTSFQPKTL